MKKILLFLIIIAGLAFLEPRSRTQIMKVIRPASEAARQRSAERALQRIALDVQKTATETGLYPQPDVFDRWLQQARRSAQDPWGSDYYIEIYTDSIVVASPGPDSRRRTPDDLRLAKRRLAKGASTARAPSGYSVPEPAPPSSSLKSSAMRKATQAARKSESTQQP